MRLTELQHLLLDLLSTHRPLRQSSLDMLSPDDWARLLSMAREHRLLPILHWRLTHERADLVLDESIRSRLHDAYRQGTLRALNIQRELARTVRTLTDAGIPCLALKGAYLAFAVYPQPGLRPLRDLDVLVDPAQALAADAALRAAGFESVDGIYGDPAACIARNKHLPPLTAPGRGVHLELHARLTHAVDERPRGFDMTGLWARQIRLEVAGQEIAYLAPTDLLLHLVYHAAYDHQLDNGPLTLCDLASLIQSKPIDWPQFWQRARDCGWLRGSLLLLRMTQRYFGELSIPYDGIAGDELEAASRFAEESGTLMLCSHDTLYGKMAISLVGQSWPRKLVLLVRRVLPTPTALAINDADAQRSLSGLLRAYGRKLHRILTIRLPGIVRELRDSSTRHDIRREARHAAELGRWLTQP